MVATTVDEIAELEEACFELARATKWEQRPIDADEIVQHADRLYRIAKEAIYEPLGRDAAVVARAVHYLINVHGMPTGDDDTRWFAEKLETVLEIARPNSGQDGKGRKFLNDMLEGIKLSLED